MYISIASMYSTPEKENDVNDRDAIVKIVREDEKGKKEEHPSWRWKTIIRFDSLRKQIVLE